MNFSYGTITSVPRRIFRASFHILAAYAGCILLHIDMTEITCNVFQYYQCGKLEYSESTISEVRSIDKKIGMIAFE